MINLVEKIASEIIMELERDELVLPTMPEVALKIRDVMGDENSTTAKIAQVIKSDAALTARLFQVANSPLLRAAKKIDTIELAISRMGNRMLRNIVTSIIMQQMFQATTEITDKLLHDIWMHSTEVAAISHVLAQFARVPADEALLAGLIHDIGALPIIKRAEDVPELLEDEAALALLIENLHPKIGVQILRKWDFPDNMLKVVLEHEQLDRNPAHPADIVDVVMVANLQSYFESDHPHSEINWADVPAFTRLGLNPAVSIVDMDEKNSESIKEIQSALS